MTSHVVHERNALTDTLHEVGPEAPTLCTGWSARMLLAHLILRERSLLEAGARIKLPVLTAAATRAMDGYARSHEYGELLATFRAGAPRYSPFALPPIRDALNLLEYVVHHEDVRRAASTDVSPRVLSESMQQEIFRRLGVLARLSMRRSPVPVRLCTPTGEILRVGKRGAEDAGVLVTGPAAELALVAFGRQRVAQVDYSGDAEAVAAIAGASFGI
jgi:uncharacterized protein (TIGR03085 family)